MSCLISDEYNCEGNFKEVKRDYVIVIMSGECRKLRGVSYSQSVILTHRYLSSIR